MDMTYYVEPIRTLYIMYL